MPSPPPIIIKKKASHGGHHGGAWKVAYADFVTAMMALFIVLWLMNSSKQIQEAVGGYFKDPSGSSKMVGTDMRGAGENFVVTRDNMKELKEQLQKSIRQIPKFDELQSHIEMTVTNEGLRIELTETANGIFFESGSDKMSADGSDLVKLLAVELGKLPNTIAIEGHTDSKPYPPGAIYTNWELSSDRANSARRLMQNNGIRQDQITQVRGFADQRLRKPEWASSPVLTGLLRYWSMRNAHPLLSTARNCQQATNCKVERSEPARAQSKLLKQWVQKRSDLSEGDKCKRNLSRCERSSSSRLFPGVLARWRKQFLVDRHVLLQLVYFYREAAIWARQCPLIRQLYIVIDSIICIINLRWIAAERSLSEPSQTKQQSGFLVEVHARRRYIRAFRCHHVGCVARDLLTRCNAEVLI